MKSIRRFCSGSVRIQMTGESPERFFNLCAASGLDIWDVIFSKGNYIKRRSGLGYSKNWDFLFFYIKTEKGNCGRPVS